MPGALSYTQTNEIYNPFLLLLDPFGFGYLAKNLDLRRCSDSLMMFTVYIQ